MKRFLLSPYEIVKSAQAGGWDEVGRCKAGNDQRTKRTGEQLGMVMLFPHLLDVTDLHEAKKWACALARRPGRRHHGRVAQVIRAAARTAVRYAGRSRLCATSAVARSLAGPQMTSVKPGPALQAHTVSPNSGAASPVFPHPHRATSGRGTHVTPRRQCGTETKRKSQPRRPEGYIENWHAAAVRTASADCIL